MNCIELWFRQAATGQQGGDLATCGPSSAFSGDSKMNRNEPFAIGLDSLARFFRRASRSNWTRHRAASLALFFLLYLLPSPRAHVWLSVIGTVTRTSAVA